MSRRSIALVLLLTTLGTATAFAQVPSGEGGLEWTTFIGGPGRQPATAVLGAAPGRLELADTPWRCGYGRARHAAIGPDNWSVQRVLVCRRGEASVSATASCRVHEGRVDEHAATLSLGTVGADAHITVTLSCRPR